MTYSGDIGSLRFLAANVMYQATGRLLASGDAEDRGVLDDAVLLMDVVSSYDTENDEKFQEEWTSIKKDRAKVEKAMKPGEELDPSVLEAFRWRELRAMFRSLCRSGKFVRKDSESATWEPTVRPKQ